MATGTALTAEIADLLEEDHSLNQIWTQSQLFDFVTQNFPLIAEATGGADKEQSGVAIGSTSGATVSITSDDTLVGMWHVRSITRDYPVIDIGDIDLLTGVSDPYSRGTPQGCTLEIEHTTDTGASVYNNVLRFFPRFTAAAVAAGTTVTFWHTDAPTTSQTIGAGVSIRDIFVAPLKYRCLSDALMADTLGKDPKRAAIWSQLSDIVSGALKSLYRGGQVL